MPERKITIRESKPMIKKNTERPRHNSVTIKMQSQKSNSNLLAPNIKSAKKQLDRSRDSNNSETSNKAIDENKSRTNEDVKSNETLKNAISTNKNQSEPIIGLKSATSDVESETNKRYVTEKSPKNSNKIIPKRDSITIPLNITNEEVKVSDTKGKK